MTERPSSDRPQAQAKRVLLVCVNPFPLSVATLRQIARDQVAAGACVDAFDAFREVFSHLPYVKPADRLYERAAAKYRRFILPEINGTDLTDQVRPHVDPVPPLPRTIDALRASVAHEARVGLAALSSAASLTKIAARDLTQHYGATLQGAWEVAHRAAAAAAQLPKTYDEVYIFNGRHAESRPFCDVFEPNSAVIRYEAGGRPNSYILSPGSLHNGQNMARRVLANPVDEEVGRGYFTARRGREPGTDAHRFTSGQAIGLLPDALSDARFVALFTSSEDEHFAIRDEAMFGVFPTQYDVALAVASLCRDRGLTLALRLHPHLAMKDDFWRTDWDFDALRALGVEIILPDERVDSYALVDASEAVVTCGSTVGTEAAFAGKPSLMVGEYFATALGICAQAKDRADIARFLDDPQPLPQARERAIMFGSYAIRSGAVIPGLTHATRPDLARLDGRWVDPMRRVVGLLKGMAGKAPVED